MIISKITQMLLDEVQPGVTARHIVGVMDRYLADNPHIKSSIKGYHGYPHSVCISQQGVVGHGIVPETYMFREGDVVNIDTAVIVDGLHQDQGWTKVVGGKDKAPYKIRKLLDGTFKALMRGVSAVKPGIYPNAIGAVIEDECHRQGIKVFRNFGGHKIGKELHEKPMIPCVANHPSGRDKRLRAGDVICIEPCTSLTTDEFFIDGIDKWSVWAVDRNPTCMFEHMVEVTECGYKVLTDKLKG